MRDEDVEERRPLEAELRDIHHRIDKMQESLHAVEVAVARGSRFPPAAWVAAISLAITVVGTGAILFAKLETTHLVASQAFTAIKDHVTAMGPAEQVVWKMDERIKSLESRIVGVGPNGWHRSDHEEYAKRVQLQFEMLDGRLKELEGKR